MQYASIPFVNPANFKSTQSAMRSLESLVIALEYYKIPIEYTTATAWQKVMLKGVKGREHLKKASKELAIKLYPSYEKEIIKEKDGDSILMALWRRGL